ncbi:hypothetical protein [uncultured Clostridium sp.]|uniref:hypothetical protein n=2 Tax=uncultured Clostridium sp. TaxID=59620 RepID=UPI0026723544|nr:hypothetical protein [uncultured Clostridium sp.]
MYIRKIEKEAFILVETMILTAVCILVLSMYVKSIIWDIEKSSLYSMNEDLLYMDEAELKFIDDVEEEINKNQELKDKIKDNELIKELEYRYTDDDLSFKITKGRIFLIKSENKNKLYRKLKTINLEEEIIIIPDYYKAYNLTY